MSLYFVEHRHTAETCPTQDRDMMIALGQHVTPDSAAKFGIKIIADVVHPGEHWMNMVLDAESEENVGEYMAPFAQVGSVSIKPVTTCEEVVKTSTC